MDDDPAPVERRRLLRTLGVGGIGTVLAGCGGSGRSGSEGERAGTDTSSASASGNGPNALEGVRVRGDGIRVRRDGGWEDFLVRGVNLGMGKPGRFPGETAITRAEYDRWLDAMAELNANAIRVYTVHPPAFYEALAAHNADADQPLYLLHGNWLPADRIEGETTAYDDGVADVFDERVRTVVDVVNGNAQLPDRPGYASGSFDVDVSAYLLGYVVGVEWEPQFVARTNADHEGGRTDGRLVRATDAATAFDRWLARRLDALATYAAETYDHRRPVSFANWPTTDHLSHPAEPFAWEDEVSVNPNHVVAADAFDPGVFATYHVYPYYPDFMNFSREYVAGDGDGTAPAAGYAGYLDDLVAANDHPVVVGEYGVPSSRGNAHEHVGGMDQGHHTEAQQGEYDAELFEAIVGAGTAGGLVFAWQDEWFKRTWNTMEYTDPDRRPYWLNVQSPEECFGLLSFDPSAGITLSGSDAEWADATRIASGSASPAVSLDDGYDAGRSLRELRAAADEGYLYLRLALDDVGDAFDWDRTRALVALDTTPDLGNTSLLLNAGVDAGSGVDFVVELGGPEDSRVWVASHYDLFYYEYSERDGVLDPAPYASEPDNGVYHPVRLATSYPLRIPTQDRTIPFRSVETGELRYGTADPTAPAYDSLTDVHADPDAGTVELRLPWQLLQFRDPSTRTVTGDIWQEGLDAGERVDGIGLAALTYAPGPNGAARDLPAPSNATDLLPADGGSIETVSEFGRFRWDTWQTPDYAERRKESFGILRDAYGRY
ncbi:hypothetical protein [Halobellus rubicundus]|uniref:Family 2 glycosyl transferase n=1 Tax=Halobellus rubicundus TaxID=2996466 RepID=A0ABD5MBJ7_9EURY